MNKFILFIATILCICSCSKQENEQVKIANEFLNYLFESKYDEAWNMYSDIEKKRVTKEEFIAVAKNFPKIADKWGKDLILYEKSVGYDPNLGATNFYKFRYSYPNLPSQISFIIHFYLKEPTKVSAFFYRGPQII